jgi:hypothetical protein
VISEGDDGQQDVVNPAAAAAAAVISEGDDGQQEVVNPAAAAAAVVLSEADDGQQKASAGRPQGIALKAEAATAEAKAELGTGVDNSSAAGARAAHPGSSVWHNPCVERGDAGGSMAGVVEYLSTARVNISIRATR